MSLFALTSGQWYAAEIIGDEFDFAEDSIRSHTPIKVNQLVPLKKRTYRLYFYHANYPAGSRDKVYELQTIERGQRFILARSTDHDPARYLLIYSITAAWLRRHFDVQIRDDDDVETWLSRNV